MRVVVQDANVLIDLQSGRIINAFFDLKWECHTTDAVLDEIEESLDAFVKKGDLHVKHLTGDELAAIVVLRAQQPRRVSIEDCTLLDLARDLTATLLTGDANLKHCAERIEIEVRGTLWLLDKMIEAGALTARQAHTALSRMLKAGRRLPRAECENRLGRWS